MAIPFLVFEIDGSSGNTSSYQTYSSWGLIPDGRLIVNPPDVRENYIEIPGRSGELDITDILTGEAVLKNRTGSWDFYVVPNGYVSSHEQNNAMVGVTPAQRTRQIYNAIHKKHARVWLSDDTSKYYTGKITVKNWPPGKTYSKITIDYNLAPGTTSGSPAILDGRA